MQIQPYCLLTELGAITTFYIMMIITCEGGENIFELLNLVGYIVMVKSAR